MLTSINRIVCSSSSSSSGSKGCVRLLLKQQQSQQSKNKVVLPFASSSSASSFERCSYSTTTSKTSPIIARPTSTGMNINNNINTLPSSSIQKRSMFIQTSTTPNPESLKFIPGRPVLDSDPDAGATTNGFYVTINDKTDIAKSPLCTNLFKNIDGVKAIYLGGDFITITKYAEYNWTHLKTPIFATIMDFYTEHGPNPQVLLTQPIITDTTILDTDDEIVAMIKELLETRIRPAVQEDGGDIHYVTYEEDSGVVYVKLAGSCVGCPSSSVTLKNGVENMLMHYIPEVSGVEAVEEENEGGSDGSDLEGGVKVDVEESEDAKKARTYEERLKAAGIPFSD